MGSRPHPHPRVARRHQPALQDGRRVLLALAALAFAGALAYSNSLSNPFVFDDARSIVTSPNVRHLWPPGAALGAPPGSGASGRPLLALTLALNYAVDGLQPRGYHVLNIVLHILASWVLFSLLRGTLRSAALQRFVRPPADGVALAVALLWLVHPLHTAALDHVTYRNEILAGLFALLTIECVRRGAASSRPAAWYASAVTAGAFAVASKEVAVVIPLLVLVYDGLFLAGTWRGALRARAALYGGLAATWILLAVLVAHADRGASVGFQIEKVTPLAYARTQIGVVVHYLRLVFWPHPLVIDYAWPIAPGFASVWWQALLLAGLVAATVALLVRRHPAGFAGALFFLVLAPTSTFVPITGAVAAEHRMYLPALGPVVLAVVVGLRGLERVAGGVTGRRIGAVVVLLATVVLASITWRRNEDYRSEIRLWSVTVRDRPQNHTAENNLGSALVLDGQVEAAVPHFEAAIRLAPGYTPAHRNLGSALLRLGQTAAGLAEIRAAVRLDPHDGMTRFKLGQALQTAGDGPAALDAYEEALRLDPTLLMAHQNAGIALMDAGRFAAAAGHFVAGLALDPDHVGTLTNLAWLRATCPDSTVRDGPAAVQAAEKAARLTRRLDPEVLDALAAAYAEAGRYDAALATLKELHDLLGSDSRAPLARLEKCRRLYAAHRPYRIGM